MSVFAAGKASFAAGEVSPLIRARYDLANYQNGLTVLRNMVVLPQGGLTRRPPTRYCGPASGDFAVSILVPFQFSTVDAYVLELGHLKARVWRDGGLVQSGGVDYVFTTPWTAAHLRGLSWTQAADIMWVVHEGYAPRKLTRTAHDAWTLSEFIPEDGPFRQQNEDESLIIKVSNHTVGATVTLTAPANTFSADWIGTYLRLEEDNKEYSFGWSQQVALAAGSWTRYAGNVYYAVTGTGGGGGNVNVNPPVHLEGTEQPSYQGPQFKYVHSGSGIVKITAVASGTSATGVIVGKREIPYSIRASGDAGSGFGTWRWARHAFGTEYGYPALVGLHEQRLVFARTPKDPQSVWLSRTFDFNSFEAGSEDDHAIGYICTSGQVNAVCWMTSGSILAIGTSGEEFVISGGSNRTGALTPETGAVKPATNEGSRRRPASRVDGSTLFVSRDERRIMEFYYDFNIDQFRADELALLADHLTVAGVAKAVWHRAPLRVLWILTDAGELLALTLRKEQKVVAWAKAEIAGTIDDIAVVPTVTGRHEELWLIVTRQVDGSAVRYVERMVVADDWPYSDALSACVYLDCQASYSGSPATTISGLSHLEGLTVGIVADGAPVPDQAVSGGEITLNDPASEVTVGLKFSSRFRTLPVQIDGQDGSSTGKIVSVKQVLTRYLNSLGGYYRAVEDSNPTRRERFLIAGPGTLGAAPALQSGTTRSDIARALGLDGEFELETDAVFPMTILSVTPVLEVNR